MDSYIQLTNMYIFDIFRLFFPFYVLWVLVLTDLSTWKILYSCLLRISQWYGERENAQEGPPVLPIRKSAICDQRASTFFLWTGVNPAQLVKSLQGLYFWELKRQPVWGPFSFPTNSFVTGDTRPSGIFQCSSNSGQEQCTWPCSKTGVALPQAESAEIQKITSFSRLFYFVAWIVTWKGSCVCHQNTYYFFLFSLHFSKLTNAHHRLLMIQQ